jgi:hypothetical protein
VNNARLNPYTTVSSIDLIDVIANAIEVISIDEDGQEHITYEIYVYSIRTYQP